MSLKTLTHLQRLEAESIHIMREVVAEAENPVMLYSVGKDSSVLMHLAMKAFYPSKPPFPFLHTFPISPSLGSAELSLIPLGISALVASIFRRTFTCPGPPFSRSLSFGQ